MNKLYKLYYLSWHCLICTATLSIPVPYHRSSCPPHHAWQKIVEHTNHMCTHETRNGTEQNEMNQGAHQLKFIYESSDFHISSVAPSIVHCWCIPQIKTHGRVSAAKKDVGHTSVLFTKTAKSPFSTPHISITTRLISIKFTYFMPCIYTDCTCQIWRKSDK